MTVRRSILCRAALLAGAASLLSACVSVPDVGPAPSVRAPADYAATRTLAGTSEGAWPAERWWTAYGDAQLDALIEEALANAPDLSVAAARVRAAEAVAQQAGAARLPRIDATGSATATKQSENNGVPPALVPGGIDDRGQVAIDIGFDLDLWGRNRAALAAATSRAEAARLEQAEARLALSTNIAAAYADLAQLHALQDVQRDALRIRERTSGLVARRVAGGLDTQAEARQAASAVPAARAELLALDEQIALTRNRIAALLGKGPDRGLAITRPSPRVTARPLPAGVSTDLIGRRPDVAAARARVEAAARQIDVARADFYPSINLSAMVGLQAFGLGNLLSGGSTFLNAGPAISLPIFRGGQLQGRYRESRAGFDEAVAFYDRAVTGAYAQVANAVTSQRAFAAQVDQRRRALADAEAAYRVAQLRFNAGLSSYLEVLSAEDRALLARRAVADLDARGFAIDVALVRALGGGFVAPTNPSQSQAQEQPGG